MTDKPVKPLPLPPVDQPANPTVQQIGALRALVTGEASKHQQGIAWNFIVRELAGVQNQSFRRDDALGMAFMEGRRFVASQMLSIITIPTRTKDDE